MNFWQRLFGGKPKVQEREPTPEEWAAICAQYDALLRPASIAHLGGRVTDDPLTSWFGGHGVARPGEAVPTYGDVPMFPLLQVNCAELPYRPPALAGTALMVVWFNQQGDPVYEQPNGDGWLIREYASLEGLAPVTGLTLPKKLKTMPITWTRSDTEGPDWEDGERLVDYGTISRREMSLTASESLMERYANHDGTKIGGYPSLIQCPIAHFDTFVFQITSSSEANWNLMDGGTLYFSKTPAGEWLADDQHY